MVLDDAHNLIADQPIVLRKGVEALSIISIHTDSVGSKPNVPIAVDLYAPNRLGANRDTGFSIFVVGKGRGTNDEPFQKQGPFLVPTQITPIQISREGPCIIIAESMLDREGFNWPWR